MKRHEMDCKIILFIFLLCLAATFGNLMYLHVGDQVFVLCNPDGDSGFKKDKSSYSSKDEYYFPRIKRDEELPQSHHLGRVEEVPVLREIRARFPRARPEF